MYQGRRYERPPYRGVEKRMPGNEDYQDIDNDDENMMANQYQHGGAYKRRRGHGESYGAFGSYAPRNEQYADRRTQSSS